MLSRWICAGTWVVAALLAGCSQPEWGPSLPPRRHLGAEHVAVGADARPLASAPAGDARAAPAEPEGELTLRTALALALARSAELESFAWSVRAAEADRLQAHLPPNPEVEAEFENFAGSGEFRGTRALETTIALSQLIELGGKRAKRRRLAHQEARLAGWDYEAKRLEVLVATAKRFIEVLALQEKLSLSREGLAVTEASLDAVRKQVDAGKAAPLSQAKAAVEAASARLGLERARRELAAARHRLAATWGAPAPRFARAAGSLERLTKPPSRESLEAKLAQSPSVARWETERARGRASVELEKARAVPDVEIAVGYRHARETDDNDRAMLVTLGIPLPLFDRNQGAIRKARATLRKARAEQRAAAVKARADLEEAYQALAAAHAAATSVRDEVLPAARRSHQIARESYRQGKSSYLDLLDAQRTLLETTEQQVEAFAAYHQAVTDVEALIGEAIGPSNQPKPSTEEQTDEAPK